MDKLKNNHLRFMAIEDLDSVVEVHQNAFPNFFLSLLGPKFLRRYYLTVLKFKNSISIVHLDADNLIDGFAVGFSDPDQFYSFFKKNSIFFIFPLLQAILRRPSLLKKIAMNTLRVNAISRNYAIKSACELSSIAVHPSGKGIGVQLLLHFIKVAKERKLKCISLTTDGDLYNKKVIDFYIRNGFTEIHREVREKRQMVHLELNLNY